MLLILCLSCNFQQTGRTNNNDSNGLTFHDSIVDLDKIARLKLTNAEDYNQLLDVLDKNNLNSINLAIQLFQNADSDTLSRDSMFVGFNDFFAQMANSYLENNDSLHSKLTGDVPEIGRAHV